jgi:hypothetical protein
MPAKTRAADANNGRPYFSDVQTYANVKPHATTTNRAWATGSTESVQERSSQRPRDRGPDFVIRSYPKFMESWS